MNAFINPARKPLCVDRIIANGSRLDEAHKVAALLFPVGVAPSEFGVGAFRPAVAAE